MSPENGVRTSPANTHLLSFGLSSLSPHGLYAERRSRIFFRVKTCLIDLAWFGWSEQVPLPIDEDPVRAHAKTSAGNSSPAAFLEEGWPKVREHDLAGVGGPGGHWGAWQASGGAGRHRGACGLWGASQWVHDLLGFILRLSLTEFGVLCSPGPSYENIMDGQFTVFLSLPSLPPSLILSRGLRTGCCHLTTGHGAGRVR